MRLTVCILISLFYFCGCTAANNYYLQIKYANLKIESGITHEEKNFYDLVNKEFELISKDFAFRNTFADSALKEKHCARLYSLIEQVLKKPISEMREKEKSKIAALAYHDCEDGYKNKLDNLIPERTIEELKFIYTKLPQSAEILLQLAQKEAYHKDKVHEQYLQEIHKAYDYSDIDKAKILRKNMLKYLTKEKNKKQKLSKSTALKYLQKALKADPAYLETYKVFATFYKSNLSKTQYIQLMNEYCKKAVQYKQWDHIYYLTEEDGNYLYKCSEAYELIAPYLPIVYVERHSE
jgi:hypothetical protein